MTHAQEDKSLKLYRASAGSGKTYRLSLEFLKLLVNDPYCYNKILAVTFTNKATTEMQTRIMGDLFSIINNQDPMLLATLRKELKEEYGTDLTDNDVRRKADRALFNILHDYSHFQVSTIDSFFQIILRNLAHELGLGAYLNIIIEADDSLDEAIDLMVEEFKTNANLRSWMNEYSSEKSADSKRWNVVQDITSFSKNIFKEIYKDYEKTLEEKLSDRSFLTEYKNKLYSIKKKKMGEILSLADKFDKILDENGFSVDDLSRGKSGAYSYINSQRRGEFKSLEESKTASNVVENSDLWATKTHARRNEIIQLGASQLTPLLLSIEKIRAENILHINTCDLIIQHFNKLGLLCDVSKQIRTVNQTRGQFMLGDTPNLLKSMIDDSDTPFIYEKIGTVLEHIMIDEFQDTSQTQWRNFMPLIKECIDKNAMNLIVGDAKQSIYRFRNGDWSIIESLDGAFPGVKPYILKAEDNWRSMENVINFNNSIFAPSEEGGVSPILLPVMPNVESTHSLFSMLKGVYAGAKQNCPKASNKGKGFVSVEYLNEKVDGMGKYAMPALLLKRVTELQEKGVRASDITILTRTSNNIAEVADYFTSYRDRHRKEVDERGLCYDLISDEAFLLSSSSALNMLINAMRITVDPQDMVSTMDLYSVYLDILYKECPEEKVKFSDLDFQSTTEFKALMEIIESVKNLPIYEMVEELCRKLQLNRLDNQTSFLSKFMDELNDFVTRRSPDVAMFLEYWDSYLNRKKIPLSDNANGIQIMTIHKSKGLEFHTVIIPYCDQDIWDTRKGRDGSLLWCGTEGLEPPYNELPVVPVDFSDNMKFSFFSADYEREKIQMLVDSINVMYVAFTRAVSNLYVLCFEENDDKMKHTSSLLAAALQNRLVAVEESESLENEDGELVEAPFVVRRFVDGSVLSSEKDGRKETHSDNPFKDKATSLKGTFESFQRRTRFRNSNKANAYINGVMDPSAYTNEAIQKGLLLHYLFSNIISEEDIPNASRRLLFEGLISSEQERLSLVDYAKEKIKEHREWFQPGLKIYNECSILSRDEKTKRVKISRPDRVIRQGNKMIIIDFKTGKRLKKHQRQVDEYASLLKKMGYETETYLWYLNDEA